MEKEMISVANADRSDILKFQELAVALATRPEIKEFPLKETSRALLELK